MKKTVVIFTIASILVACGCKDVKVKTDVVIEDSITSGIEDSSSVGNRRNLFYCIGNGQPIKSDKYQNGTCDCPDGSDELPGTCK